MDGTRESTPSQHQHLRLQPQIGSRDGLPSIRLDQGRTPSLTASLTWPTKAKRLSLSEAFIRTGAWHLHLRPWGALGQQHGEFSAAKCALKRPPTWCIKYYDLLRLGLTCKVLAGFADTSPSPTAGSISIEDS